MQRDSSLISESYRDLNRRLHGKGSYGRWGDKWAAKVTELVTGHGIASVLDYGCGQGALARAVDFDVAEYDPAIAGKEALPAPAELVVCTDVMEHIEPARLANVIAHLHDLTQRMLFVTISTRPAAKHLEDGRNAHLIVEDSAFWQQAFADGFETVEWDVRQDEIVALLTPRAAADPGR